MSTANSPDSEQNISSGGAGASGESAQGKTVLGTGDTSPTSMEQEGSSDRWIGRNLSKYHILEMLGQGGMGAVYRAHDDSLSRDVALKILPHDLAADSNLRERFLAEARSAARISHPNTVPIFEIGHDDKTYFIAMELIPGGNVEDSMPAGGAYPATSATRMIADACRGLSAAHKTGLIHRDIKPANLLIAADGTIKLADFGLAKESMESSQGLTRTGQIMGTPYFMSPEQCQAKPLDHRSDIYSLGATYYTLLTGRRPYSDIGSGIQVMYAHCHGTDLDPRECDPTIPEDCAQIVLRSTAKRPEDRYQSADEMLKVLEQAVDHQKASAVTKTSAPAPPMTGTSKRSGRARWLRGRVAVGAAVVTILLASGFGVLSFWQNGGQEERGSDGREAVQGPLARGVTSDTITFGTTTAYSGANQGLGRDMVLGIRTCFAAANDAGGINGRQLKLVVLDDGYEPDRAIENMHKLFEEHHVFGVIGNVGTPTAKVTVPYAIEHRDLFFAPFTGASFLRQNPPERYVYNYRAGYADETKAIVQYFVEVKRIPANQIAVFAQNDSYGDDGYRGVTDALRTHGVQAENVLRVNYDRNTVKIDEAVEKIASRQENIRAIVMVATYKPAARFVKELKDRKTNLTFAALSFVGSEAMSEEFREIGADYAEGVIVTQTVPFFHSAATGVIRYREMLAKYYPEAKPGFVSLEGFIAAECLIEGLKRVQGGLTTESLIDALDSIRDLDLGIGPIINFGPSRHQASDRVWGTILDATANFRTLDLERP